MQNSKKQFLEMFFRSFHSSLQSGLQFYRPIVWWSHKLPPPSAWELPLHLSYEIPLSSFILTEYVYLSVASQERVHWSKFDIVTSENFLTFTLKQDWRFAGYRILGWKDNCPSELCYSFKCHCCDIRRHFDA